MRKQGVTEPAFPNPLLSSPRVLAIGDTHFPYASEAGVQRTVALAKELHPTHIIQMGDLYDLYAYSKYPHRIKDPAWELDAGRTEAETFWELLHEEAPQASCYQLRGNHDERPLKRTLERAPELVPLIGDSIRELFTFDGVTTIHDPREELVIGDVWYLHGYRGRIGEHARWNNRKTVCGHLHRGGVVHIHDVWELNAGWLGDRTNEVFDYKMQKRLDGTTLGCGWVDPHGPRFCIFT